MEIIETKEDYNKSSLGLIPNDWEQVHLNEVAKVIDGDRSSNYPSGNDIVDEGILFLSTKNIVNSFFDYHDTRFISKEKFDSIKKGKLKKDDLVITMRGSIGNVARFTGVPFQTALINAQMSIIRPTGINSEYLWSSLNSFIMPRYLQKITSGSAQPQLTKKDVEKIPIPLPPIGEQQKIALILSTWDKAIELKEKLIKQKKRQKKGLMQKLLTGEMRLPGFKGKWKNVRIKDISGVVTGTTPSTSNKDYYENGIFPWITPTDITDSKYISESERNLTEKGLEKGRFVPSGSLLVTCIASIGKNAILTKNGSCNQQINAISPSNSHSNEFLYYKLEQDIKRMETLAGKSATSIINKNTFEKFEISIPKLEEQIAIAAVLSKIDEIIELSRKELEQLKQQKKGLMQLLLTGKVRVKV